MIVSLKVGADVRRVQRDLAALGLWTLPHRAADGRTFLAVESWSSAVAAERVAAVPGVESVGEPPSAHPRLDTQPRRIDVAGIPFGEGAEPVLIAGPCSVESAASIDAAAARLARCGVRMLRGGAFKPRTSPYSFQGAGLEALEWLAAAGRRHGLAVVSEAIGEATVGAVAERVDLVQIGSRNMQNIPLLRAAGRCSRPVLLKRGMAATLDEWLLAAEHCLHAGAPAVLFCERGVRGFDPSTRNLLDLGAVAMLAHAYGLPVLVDPSHAAGRRDLVLPLARAALAAGACGLLIETHDAPGEALSDGPQAIATDDLAAWAAAAGLPREAAPARP